MIGLQDVAVVNLKKMVPIQKIKDILETVRLQIFLLASKVTRQ